MSGQGGAAPGSQQEDLTTTIVVQGNPNCADLGYSGGSYKFDPPVSDTRMVDSINSITVNMTSADSFDWTATLGIDAVIVKAGDQANVYLYDPESFGDTGLHGDINPVTGEPYNVSHIEFCFDYELHVTKDADPSFTRTYEWAIDKVGSESELLLSAGQTFTVDYSVEVSAVGSTDSDWGVTGFITIENPAPEGFTAIITGVSDEMTGGIAGAVDCGDITFPYALAAGETLICSYTADLPDGTTRTNTATVTTDMLEGSVEGDSGEAVVDFAAATVNGEDDCVDVDDDRYGFLGTYCVGDGSFSHTYNYPMEVGPYAECGTSHRVDNVASYTTNDSGSTGSDMWSLAIEVAECSSGCALTPGYWKTHSEYGPAPYDDTWAHMPNGADTPFFDSGLTYYEVLWTAPRGDAWFILAHAYIAAELNFLNGASSTSDVSGAFAEATAIFETTGPGGISRRDRRHALELATILDDYNNGLVGPGHCSE